MGVQMKVLYVLCFVLLLPFTSHASGFCGKINGIGAGNGGFWMLFTDLATGKKTKLLDSSPDSASLERIALAAHVAQLDVCFPDIYRTSHTSFVTAISIGEQPAEQ
jgi:hypothetical protein